MMVRILHSLRDVSCLDRLIEERTTTDLGPVITRTDIQSSLGPFHAVPDYKVRYPDVVISALCSLCKDYNAAFKPLVAANREWATDYRHCHINGETEEPVNFAVQIDMVGLPQSFLEEVSGLHVEDVRNFLKHRIFEIENSLAMYQLLERIFSDKDGNSFFKTRFRSFLAGLKAELGMPIALLAVTDQKYQAMKSAEFGKGIGEQLLDRDVSDLSGFDRFFGPAEFQRHLEENGGACKYLLYARTSDPIEKLKKPDFVVEHLLLGDSYMREVIKAHALTINIDMPEMEYARRVNDTKAYMAPMGMAYDVNAEEDLLTKPFIKHLFEGGAYEDYPIGARFSPAFLAYLTSQGLDPERVEQGKAVLHYKPLKGTYGCYGHLTGTFGDIKFRKRVRKSLRERGSYIVQPKMSTPVVVNKTDGQAYTYIDRNFFAFSSGCPVFLGGFRSLMPLDSVEAQNGRNHGNKSTVWAEILT